MPPPTMSNSAPPDCSQMSSQRAMPRRVNDNPAPSIASRAESRSASYPRCVLNPSEVGSESALWLKGLEEGVEADLEDAFSVRCTIRTGHRSVEQAATDMSNVPIRTIL